MSSGSDDEDELLQMALMEQSQRDVSYQKPPSSNSRKPVANFVQPPSQTRPQKPAGSSVSNAVAHKKAAARKMSMDDDDESELEILSISSGDDDVGRDRGGGGGRGKGGGGARGLKEEESAWDGEEPDCWKRVDEAEVCIACQFLLPCW